ncbi:MAG: hypothetical protein M5U34_47345 [Chloroflexi bacterium]|nr:hypothetical protein [Chloroflexota bacterium]
MFLLVWFGLLRGNEEQTAVTTLAAPDTIIVEVTQIVTPTPEVNSDDVDDEVTPDKTISAAGGRVAEDESAAELTATETETAVSPTTTETTAPAPETPTAPPSATPAPTFTPLPLPTNTPSQQ